MKTLIFSLLISCPMIMKSQHKKIIVKDGNNQIEQIGFLNQNNQKDSSWSFFNGDKIISQGFFKNGVKDGPWLSYYDNQKPSIEIVYNLGEKILGRRWDENGNLIETKNFK